MISGNQQSGILVEGSAGNTIVGNTIGVAPDGITARPNAWSGITMYDGSANTVIQNNTISGNGQWGIDVQHSGALAPVTGTQIIGNTIGLDGAGNAAGNGSGGVRLDEAPNTAIGTAGAGNVISGNVGGHGIDINGSGSTGVTVQGEHDRHRPGRHGRQAERPGAVRRGRDHDRERRHRRHDRR